MEKFQLIVFFLIRNVPDGISEVSSGEDPVKVIADCSFRFCRRERLGSLVESLGVFPALEVLVTSGTSQSERRATHRAFEQTRQPVLTGRDVSCLGGTLAGSHEGKPFLEPFL